MDNSVNLYSIINIIEMKSLTDRILTYAWNCQWCTNMQKNSKKWLSAALLSKNKSIIIKFRRDTFKMKIKEKNNAITNYSTLNWNLFHSQQIFLEKL
jgi:hypothetical protein